MDDTKMDNTFWLMTASTLPVVSMAFLLKVKRYSDSDFSFVAPQCNMRYVSSSRISSMLKEADAGLSHSSACKVLLCEETTECSIDFAKGHSLFFRNEYDDSKFVFKVQVKSFFPIYCLSMNDTPEIVNEDSFRRHYNKFQDGHQTKSKNVCEAFCELIKSMAIKYKFSTNFDEGCAKMYEDMKKLSYLSITSGLKEETLPEEASTALKAVIHFQQMCPLRITNIEGNHRHVLYLSNALHLSVDSGEIPRLHLTKSNKAMDISCIEFTYSVYAAEGSLSTEKVVEEAINLSKLAQKQIEKAIPQEDLHFFVKMLYRCSEKLKDEADLSSTYNGKMEEILKDTSTGRENKTKRIHFNKSMSVILDKQNKVLCEGLGIRIKELTGKRRRFQTHLYNYYENEPALFEMKYEIPDDAAGITFLLIFLDRCFDELTCSYVSQLFNKCYHYLHHSDCIYHGISPTLTINSVVLEHAAKLNALLTRKFTEGNNRSDITKFLAPQFFFFVVIVIWEHIGLYPVLRGEHDHYTWVLSEEEKSYPPSNFNSFRFLIYCIDGNEDFVRWELNRFFWDELKSYGNDHPFPKTFTEFHTPLRITAIKNWFYAIAAHEDNYVEFIGQLVNGVSPSTAKSIAVEPLQTVSITGQKKRKRCTETTSDSDKLTAKSIPVEISRTASLTGQKNRGTKATKDSEQAKKHGEGVYTLKRFKSNKEPNLCEGCEILKLPTKASALVIDNRKGKETRYCKFHATEWYADHESLKNCVIHIPKGKNEHGLTYRHYKHTNEMLFRLDKKGMRKLSHIAATPSKNCQENINADCECPIDCEMGKKCCNQKIRNLRKRPGQEADPRFTIKLCANRQKGYGLFSNICFGIGEVILEYVGEVLPSSTIESKDEKLNKFEKVYHACLTDSLTVTAECFGNESRFINHSCDPNAKMNKWEVDCKPTIVITACKKIQKGDEITTDYAWSTSNDDKTTTCLCRAKKCRGNLEGVVKKTKGNEAITVASPGGGHETSQNVAGETDQESSNIDHETPQNVAGETEQESSNIDHETPQNVAGETEQESSNIDHETYQNVASKTEQEASNIDQETSQNVASETEQKSSNIDHETSQNVASEIEQESSNIDHETSQNVASEVEQESSNINGLHFLSKACTLLTGTRNELTIDGELKTLISEKGMQERIEVLTSVEDYLDLNQLLSSVKAYIKENLFQTLPKSNVMQFRRHEIEKLGIWGCIVRGKTGNIDQRTMVKQLKDNVVTLLKTSMLLPKSNIKWDAIEITLLQTDPASTEKQNPHTDYEIKPAPSPHHLAWTAHLPINKNDGSYMYIWQGPGCGTAVHIKGGQCLLLRSDVVHSGGLPEAADKEKSYIRLHFYIPTDFQLPPIDYKISTKGPDGNYYYVDHWHQPKPKDTVDEIDGGVGRIKSFDVPFQLQNYFKDIVSYAKTIKKERDLNTVNVKFSYMDDYLKDTDNQQILNAFIAFFQSTGIFELGVLQEKMICSVFHNLTDEASYQTPHTDYFYKAVDPKSKKKKQWMAWSAIIPITNEGAWLTIWGDRTKPVLLKISYGKAIFFRSDVIHASCRPSYDKRKNLSFYRLHFYLQTEFQKAPNDEINIYDLDGVTELKNIVSGVRF